MGLLVRSRTAHLLFLATVTLCLTLPGLGAPSLWDIDEGLNAEASREMLEAGNWVVPRFNFDLRTAKPVLLNWLQMVSYSAFGVNEWAARLHSVLAAVISVLGVYGIGRRLFDPLTGVLGGLILASSALFAGLAHAATPDAVLTACVVLTFLAFVVGTRSAGADRPVGAVWYALVGVATGLGTLDKGPVALGLPALILAVWLVWCGRWRQLVTGRLGLVLGAFVLVAVPWYVLVGLETRGEFPRAFFLREYLGRATEPMERHGGGPWYHPLVLLVGLAPWSVFIGPSLWYAWRNEPAGREGCRLLGLWAGVWVGIFSLAATKLPGYVVPAYPAFALLTARFLVRWARGEIQPVGWLAPVSLSLLGGVGVFVTTGLILAGSGAVSHWQSGHPFSGLEWCAPLGLPLLLAAAAGGWYLFRGMRMATVATVAAGSLVFVAAAGAVPLVVFDAQKAPRALVARASACIADREVRVAAYGWFQPTVVFYCRRQVCQLQDPLRAAELLDGPLEAYLFVPADEWERIREGVRSPTREAGRHWDLYARREVLVVTNR